MPTNTKAPWQSKTIVINTIGFLLMAALPFFPVLAHTQTWIATNASLIGSIWAGLNVLLRFLTKDAVGLGD